MNAKEFYEFVKELTGSDKMPVLGYDYSTTAMIIGGVFMSNLFSLGKDVDNGIETQDVDEPFKIAVYDCCMKTLEENKDLMRKDQESRNEWEKYRAKINEARKDNNG